MSHESQRKPKHSPAVTDSPSKWRKQANFKHVNNELSVPDFVQEQRFPPAPSCELLGSDFEGTSVILRHV